VAPDPALQGLEQAGLIAGRWLIVAGRRRRMYQLTQAGIRALTGRRADWHEFAAMMTAALEPRPCPNARIRLSQALAGKGVMPLSA
jgi:PadR family transcriptional regulator